MYTLLSLLLTPLLAPVLSSAAFADQADLSLCLSEQQPSAPEQSSYSADEELERDGDSEEYKILSSHHLASLIPAALKSLFFLAGAGLEQPRFSAIFKVPII